jgi:hypothetical protein
MRLHRASLPARPDGSSDGRGSCSGKPGAPSRRSRPACCRARSSRARSSRS